MALRLKPETRAAWQKRIDAFEHRAAEWRPVPRAEPATEKVYDTHTFDIYCKTWVDT